MNLSDHRLNLSDHRLNLSDHRLNLSDHRLNLTDKEYLIYSCVFFQEKYVELLELLFKSFILFGREKYNYKYLVICDPKFKDRIYNLMKSMDIVGDIWCLDLEPKLLDAACARLRIFDYPKISEFSKILYLDTDILVLHSLSKIFDLQIENKLYALQEGHTSITWLGIQPGWWGSHLFEDNNPSVPGINSGVLLFPRCDEIKNLFQRILHHVQIYDKEIHPGLDQPFINYHAIKDNLYNDTSLIGLCVNNAYPFKLDYFKMESIMHFPVGGPGNYGNKFQTMAEYLKLFMKREFYENLKVDEQQYKQKIKENIEILNQIDNICKNSGELVEGNCFTEHLNIDNKLEYMVNKQMNHFSLGGISQNIMEIGFNAGHSTLLFLLSNPNSKITLFDLCEHKYTQECFDLLDKYFPNRLSLIKGDSRVTLSQFIKENPSTKFDLIHIDGGHFGNTPYLDFYYSNQLSNGYIIFDDTNLTNINHIFEEFIIKGGFGTEVKLYETYFWQHRIIQKNILDNQKFSWGENIIEFKPKNKINAFGEGNYKFIGDHLVTAEFRGKIHLMKFDRDYGKMYCIRIGDFNFVKCFKN